MANTIKHKRGTTTPTAGQLLVGEIAINTATGAVFTKTDGGSVLALNSASPTFTGTPAAPTATAGTSTTQIATTAFVTAVDILKAPLASPTFTGTPTLPTGTIGVTQATGDSTTALSTTAFVQQELAALDVGELHNATISSPADNDLFVYENSTSLWKNKTFATLGLLTDAPSDGSEYVRKNAAWSVATGGGGGLADAPSDGDEYVRKDGAWAVATAGGGGSYLPLAGGTMTGGIVFDAVGGQSIDKGTFDSSRYGYNGISLKCAVGFELNWQSGWLTGNQFLGTPNICPIYIDSGVGSTLRVWEGTTSTGTEVSHTGIVLAEGANITVAESANHDSEMAGWGFGVQQSDDHGKGTTVEFNGLHTYDGASHTYVTPTGITFTDTTVQTTAWIDASSDGKAYSRKDGGWVQGRINAYDSAITYQVGDQVTYNSTIYQLTTSLGGAGYDPVTYISNWTPMNAGSTGAPGAAGANGAAGAMNPMDILTVMSSSNPGWYESGGNWSLYYGFPNTSAGWFYGKLSGGVDFKIYLNGVFDSYVNAAYNYYYVSGSMATLPTSGDVVTVYIYNSTIGEATIPLLTYSY